VYENASDEFDDWVENKAQESSTRFKPEYLPQSAAFGPNNIFCVIYKNGYKTSPDFDKVLPDVARVLKAADEAKSIIRIVGVSF